MDNIIFYWINIDKSIYRRKFMEKQFEIHKINNKRISAITPEKLNDLLIDNEPYYCGNECCKYNNCNDCKFEYSCSTSHLEAIKEGYKSGKEYFIICEDDIYFPFKIDYNELIKSLPDDWDIFQMMVLDEEANINLYNNYYKKNINYIKFNPYMRLFSTGMYLINRKGAKKLLKLFIDNKNNKYELTSKTINRQADFLLYMNTNTYTSTFPYCHPNLNFISEIHPNHFYLHLSSIKKIRENLEDSNNKNKFILEYYPFEELNGVI